MSSFVAIIKSIVGQVFATSLDGLKRQVFEGERLFQGEQLITALGSSVTLQLANGDQVDIGESSQWQAGRAEGAEQAQADNGPTSELEQAIAAGLDPTAELEPTAAGPGATGGAGGAQGGGHSFVMLDETGQQLDPTVGFETAGLAFTGATTTEEDSALVNPATTPAEAVAPFCSHPQHRRQGKQLQRSPAAGLRDQHQPGPGQRCAGHPEQWRHRHHPRQSDVGRVQRRRAGR
ncbi:retention module-containing protein [Pseudomonas lalucatii]|nr:retention module-containing protein [Pseudomonas lalucatii]